MRDSSASRSMRSSYGRATRSVHRPTARSSIPWSFCTWVATRAAPKSSSIGSYWWKPFWVPRVGSKANHSSK